MSDCFDYSSDDTKDDDQYGDEAFDNNQYNEDDFYHSDDQYSGRNQLSDYASEVQLVLTDQDPTILHVVEAIFPTSNHRLYM
uniref:Uncharacterized protein n=1 Tax=Lactuca sativa TaxID=4236 RepID=A0A9R1WCN6_LACSA|nr:hypothetical protein LSAT_V11C200077610 [Lactuca sativa]